MNSAVRSFAAILLSGVLLSAAAVYNRYPFVWPDTECYVRLSNLIFRTPFYSLLVYPVHLTWSLWPVVLFQSLIVAALLHLTLRTTFGSAGALRLLVTVFILTIISSLPWVTGLIMPDVFTSVLVLAVFLLGFRAELLNRFEQASLFVIVVISITVHLSHVPLAVAQICVIGIFGIAFRKSSRIRVSKWWVMAVPVLMSLGLILTNNIVNHDTAQLSPGGYCMQLARLVADGPAVSYLKEKCRHRRYALCEYIHELPDNSDRFLWGQDSPLSKVGGFDGYWREAQKIVWGTV
ncbi:MAG: hypothetical protein JRJ60_15745, partial [Deltaproteobacteria bacterium]|nr:hypothetical protein [Deltaproteobacteria bacterium]